MDILIPVITPGRWLTAVEDKLYTLIKTEDFQISKSEQFAFNSSKRAV